MAIENRYAFFDGEIVPIERAKISIMTSAFNYGTAIFEGLRGYWSDEAERLYVFRLHEHIERLRRNGRILMMDLPHPVAEIEHAVVRLLRKEAFREDVYVRPLLYKSACEIGPRIHGDPCALAIFAAPFGRYLDTKNGIAACVSSWRRLADNAIPPRGKITGAYVDSALAKSEAILNGFDEAILLSEEGLVSEATAANLFLVRNRELITPPVTADILEGITRATLIALAREDGIPVVERSVHRSELYVADEIFLCGTASEVAPVIEVDRRAVADGVPGGITRTLAARFEDLVRGRSEDSRGWLTAVDGSSRRSGDAGRD